MAQQLGATLTSFNWTYTEFKREIRVGGIQNVQQWHDGIIGGVRFTIG